jgi:hypothetical protein
MVKEVQMTAKEKTSILFRAAKLLRSKTSGVDERIYKPTDSSSKVYQWDGWEYCIDIGTLSYPCSATLGLWIAEYGEAGRKDKSTTRCWLGLEFASWQLARQFVRRVPKLRAVQYYGGPKTAAMVRAEKGQKKRQISLWLSRENLDKVGIETSYGYYYLGKYFKEVLSVNGLPPMKRLIAFGNRMTKLAGAASPVPMEKLKKWGKKSLQKVLQRPDQAKFRKQLLQAYGRCAISGFGVEDALVAAHIRPFVKGQEQGLENGLLLRADLHMLFDAHLITVCESKGQYLVAVSNRIKKSGYFKEFNGKPLVSVPKNPSDWPCKERLFEHSKGLKGQT